MKKVTSLEKAWGNWLVGSRAIDFAMWTSRWWLPPQERDFLHFHFKGLHTIILIPYHCIILDIFFFLRRVKINHVKELYLLAWLQTLVHGSTLTNAHMFTESPKTVIDYFEGPSNNCIDLKCAISYDRNNLRHIKVWIGKCNILSWLHSKFGNLQYKTENIILCI